MSAHMTHTDEQLAACAAAEDPWVMHLILRKEKGIDPPAINDALVAAARATVLLLTDQRARTDWAPAISAWTDEAIRKVTLRARGARWRDTRDMEGVCADVGLAEVCALVPVRRSERPAALAKFQALTETLEGCPHERTPPAPASRGARLWLSPYEMSTGKAMAQVAHGAQLLLGQLSAQQRQAWLSAGVPVEIRHTYNQLSFFAMASEQQMVVVRDAGLTEVPAGTVTVAAEFLG